TLRDSVADLRVKDGLASLTRLETRLEGAPLTGSAVVYLDSPYRIQGNVVLTRWDLASLQRLNPEIQPPVKVAGVFATAVKFDGTLLPLRVQTTGTADAADLRVAELKFNHVHAGWVSDANRVTLKEVRANLYEGEV